MSEPQKLKLQYLSFRDVSVVTHVTAYGSAISYWDADKHPLIRVEERNNGDVWFHHPNGFITELAAWKVDSRVRRPVKPTETKK